jgi:phosphatidylserine decarboxylase
MLAKDDSIDQFVGGTVYQAYLTAINYHRWHSPWPGRLSGRSSIPLKRPTQELRRINKSLSARSFGL